ncbi:MAG: hypothetical protein LUH36_08085 [Oscillospiraceae bacterium]|nr:hypothetical protein [Oscillospiraceae bacterium]
MGFLGLFSRPKKQAQPDAAAAARDWCREHPEAVERDWYREHPRDAAYFSDLFAQAAPDCQIASRVPAEALNPAADPDCVPVDFLFVRQERPVLAVLLVEQNTYRRRAIRAAERAVEQAGVPCLRFFADMANKPEYVVSRIQEALGSQPVRG